MLRFPFPSSRAVLLLVLLSGIIFGSFAARGVVYGQSDVPDGRDQALATLEEILRRPEFQWQEQQPTFWERAWEWLLRRLANLFPDSLLESRTAVVILAAGGVVLLLLILLYITRRLRREITTLEETTSDVVTTGLRDARLALDQARSLSEKGDYRLALRYLYLSTLLLLEERGFLRYDRSRTNMEYLQSVANRPQLAATLREIIDIFERTWYGLQVPDAQTYARFERQVKNLREFK